jgi:arabinofuranan 3-O-arabinosyltransferase
VVGDHDQKTAVRASPLQLARGLPVEVEPCGNPTEPSVRSWALDAGENDVSVRASDAFAPGTLLLQSNDAAQAPAPTTSDTGSSDPVRRTVRPGAGDTVVALRENTNPGWVATQAGKPLRPIVLDGWQQGWRLRGPGPVQVDFAPDRAYRIGFTVGLGALLLLVGLVGLVAVGGRRRKTPVPAASGTRRLPAPLVLGVALIGVGLVAGWIGLALAVTTGLVSRLLVRRRQEEAPWLLAAPALLAALAYFALPWGSSSGWAGNDAWPHYLVLVPLVAVLLRVDDEPWRLWARGRRPLSRRAGRSTSR